MLSTIARDSLKKMVSKKLEKCNNNFKWALLYTYHVIYSDKWNLEGGKSYYFSRNNSTLVAFIVGAQATNTGVSLFKIVGCHTDSPVLKLAPVSKMHDRNGY